MGIPYLSVPDRPITASTQELLPLVDIVGGIVVYNNGGAAQIMETTSLNFGLLSEREQEAVIASYAGMLNSFNFPVQIVVRSQKKDISRYMDFLNAAESKVKIEKLKIIMADYKAFVQEAIKKKNVLSKKFYIVIPFTPFELGLAKSVAVSFNPNKKQALPFPRSYVLRKAKTALYPKRDHIIRQAGRLQIEVKALTDEELIKLFFDIFNPEPPIKEKENLY
jgi:hypothetical protein